MRKRKEPLDIVKGITESVSLIRSVNNDDELKNAYKDEFTTEQQKIRDKEVTNLLKYYTDGYRSKVKTNKVFKITLFIISCLILSGFSVIFCILLLDIKNIDNKEIIAGIVKTVTVCVTFLTLIVGILKIITKYVFSDKDEEYITKIVEIIQNNDLENKKQNIMVKSNTKINDLVDDINDKHDER